MKRRADPRKLVSVQQRGSPREPDALRRYRLGERGNTSVLDCFPHGRYCLGLHLDCPRKNREEPDELRVRTFYRATLPWLHPRRLPPASHQRCIDFVAFLDELMDREDTMYASNTPWPLAELLAIVDEAALLLACEPYPNPRDPDADPEHLAATFTACAAILRSHVDCCQHVLVNVHWW